ncbi:MAG: family 3 adenylate cyclase [Candidatus Gracilibacteria bacterium]|nr:family 3 adenylate cyclase [Candidatus Gracilibacteria bacterium]
MANKTKFLASLFNLSQDIIENIPFEIIDEWIKSDQSLETAKRILEPTKVRGISVSSDSAGLSSISIEKELIEVLGIISYPKEIIYGIGKSIGGQGIGIWAADNTQMFFDESIDPNKVVSAFLYLQEVALKKCEINIGFGLHFGEKYLIGGGLYGEEADFIEMIAEDNAKGGEVLISGQLWNLLDKNQFKMSPGEDINHPKDVVYRIDSGVLLRDVPINLDYNYPIPFSQEFFKDLRKFYSSKDKDLLDVLNGKYLQEKTIVLVERKKEKHHIEEISLLNDIALYALMEQGSHDILKNYNGLEIKTVGSLGIYEFDYCDDAINFTLAFRESLKEEGVECKIGVADGSVIIFNLANGNKDIAGNPINIASKLAQDKGEFGKIYLTREVFEKLEKRYFEYENIEINVSGINIDAIKI